MRSSVVNVLVLLANDGLFRIVVSEILSSSDLNCGFDAECRWRNGTNGQEDGADFVAGHNLEMDEFHRITALRPDQDDFFVYTYAIGGRQEAMLISDVISCQLGGASIKYWYWKTGKDVALDVCIRQPPGSRDRNTFKCYDGLSSTFAQQWIFRAIELPPVSQPFEIIFRATFTAPLDILALDNIVYDAILCDGIGVEESPNPPEIRARRALAPPSLTIIDIASWRKMQSDQGPKKVMLIVSEPVPEIVSKPVTEPVSNSILNLVSETTTKPVSETSRHEVPEASEEGIDCRLVSTNYTILPEPETKTTTTPHSTVFPTLIANMSETDTTTAAVNFTTASVKPTASTPATDHLQNAVQFFKQIQPVLPYIPTLVRTLQSVDPRVAQATGTDPLVELNELSKIIGIDLVETTSELRRAAAHMEPSHMRSEEQRVADLVSSFGAKPIVPQSGRSKSSSRYDGSLLTSRVDGFGVHPIKTEVEEEAPKEANNIFGLERSGKAVASPTFLTATVYPPRLVKSLKTTIQRPTTVSEQSQEMVEETMDLSHLSTAEIKQLEQFHRKIFRGKSLKLAEASESPSTRTTPKSMRDQWHRPPLVVFGSKEPSRLPVVPPAPLVPLPESTGSVSDLLLERFDDLKSVLPSDAISDLEKLREIPNLDQLTEGMDVSLINKPGGFAELKKEFMQRMIRRSLGLPPILEKKPSQRKPLPPPIVPIKVTRRMVMKQRARHRARN